MSHWIELVDPDGPVGAYLPWKLVESRVGISRTTAWRLQRAGDFPKPYVMSRGRVAYRESEIEAWKASRGHRGEPIGVAQPSPPSAAVAEPVIPGRSQLELDGHPLGSTQDDRGTGQRPRPKSQAGASRRRSSEPGRDQMTFDF